MIPTHKPLAWPMAGDTTPRGPLLPQWGARVTLCPEGDGHRTVYRLRVIADSTQSAKGWQAILGSRHAAIDLAMREGWHLDETGEACA